jgi:hypothetical protein
MTTFDPSVEQLTSKQLGCNTSSENSSKSKTNTTTGKTVLKLVKILSFRNIGLFIDKVRIF